MSSIISNTYPRTLQFHIDGEWIDGGDRAIHQVVNPATGEPIADLPKATKADLDRALDAAERAFPFRYHGRGSQALLRSRAGSARRPEQLRQISAGRSGRGVQPVEFPGLYAGAQAGARDCRWLFDHSQAGRGNPG